MQSGSLKKVDFYFYKRYKHYLQTENMSSNGVILFIYFNENFKPFLVQYSYTILY